MPVATALAAGVSGNGLLEQEMERGEPAYNKENDGAAYASAVPVLQRRCAQLFDFSHNLAPPHLTQLMSAAVGKIVVLSVVVNPIKDRQGVEFVVQACQRLLPPPHIGLFDAGRNFLRGDPVEGSVWQVSRPARRIHYTR